MPGRHWTREQRAQQSQLIHTWKPWKKAGVKTAEGKAISSRNAFKGGSVRAYRNELSILLKEHREFLKRFANKPEYREIIGIEPD